MSTHYAANSVLRFEALNTTIHSVNVNPAISYKLYEKISLGIGLQAQYLKTNISNFNGMYTGGAALDAMLAANNPSNLNAHGWGYGNSLGVLFNPNAQTRIGVGFRSSIRTKLQGDGQQYTWPGPVVPAPSNAFCLMPKLLSKPQ